MKHIKPFENYEKVQESVDDAEEVGRVKFGHDNDIVVKRGEGHYVITQKSKIVPSKTNTIVVTDDVLQEFLDIFRPKAGAGESN